ANATDSTLTLFSVQTNQAGNYSVFVTNSVGNILSSNALLTVIPPPPCVNPSSNLISWWRGESNALDQIGGHNGTLSNNVTFSAGQAGAAFVFDGDGSVVRIGNPPALQIQDFTIELWARRSSSSSVSLNGNGNGHLFSFDNNGYGLYLDPSGHPALTKVGVD